MIGNIKIIAVCMCKVYDERNYRIIRALNNFAVENDYRLFVYHTCSDLYWKTLSEKGEQSVFDLIDYNITDAVVTFEEGVYAENVMTKIRMDAAKYGKPVISVGVEQFSESYSRSMISHSEMMSFITVTIGLFLL